MLTMHVCFASVVLLLTKVCFYIYIYIYTHVRKKNKDTINKDPLHTLPTH